MNRKIDAAKAGDLAFALSSKMQAGDRDLRRGVSMTFLSADGQKASSTDPLTKAVLCVLAEGWPSVVTCSDILQAAIELLRTGGDPGNGEDGDSTANRVGGVLVTLLSNGFVDVFGEPVQCARKMPAKLLLTPLMRYQALTAAPITNRLHVPVPADPAGRGVAALCDGSRTESEIAAAVVSGVREGRLELTEGGRPVTDDDRLRHLLEPRVHGLLQRFLDNGFFAA